jgi:outer membrane murein-binding lipoprotein Lpp
VNIAESAQLMEAVKRLQAHVDMLEGRVAQLEHEAAARKEVARGNSQEKTRTLHINGTR